MRKLMFVFFIGFLTVALPVAAQQDCPSFWFGVEFVPSSCINMADGGQLTLTEIDGGFYRLDYILPVQGQQPWVSIYSLLASTEPVFTVPAKNQVIEGITLVYRDIQGNIRSETIHAGQFGRPLGLCHTPGGVFSSFACYAGDWRMLMNGNGFTVEGIIGMDGHPAGFAIRWLDETKNVKSEIIYRNDLGG